MCRLTAAHKTIRLMLLGPPPDMVHGALLHRTRTPIFRNGSDSRTYAHSHTLCRDEFYYTTGRTKFQVVLQKNFIFSATFLFSKKKLPDATKTEKVYWRKKTIFAILIKKQSIFSVPIIDMNRKKEFYAANSCTNIHTVFRTKRTAFVRLVPCCSRLFPHMRHEILNESHKQIVCDDILKTLEAWNC